MRRSLLLYTMGLLLAVGSHAQKKLFESIPARKSGVTFNNVVTDEIEHNVLIYSNYYGGAGVGLGDINNDGLLDVFFAGNQVGDQLYLNQGDFRFEEITKQAGIEDNGGWSSGVLMADINEDGFIDIYVTRELYDNKPELRKNKLYINNGDLTFTESAEDYGLEDDARTRHATFLDYDHDGDLDLFLLNQPPNPGNYSDLHEKVKFEDTKYSPRLYENRDLKFVDVTREAGLLRSGFPNSAIASDLNNDGWVDIYVANDFWAPDFYYLNNGDGTFTDVLQEEMKHISFYSMGVDAADINNDGWMDIMVLDMVAEDNFRLKANMSGMDPSAFWKVVDDGGHYQYMFNTLHLNNGPGSFSDIAQLTGMAATDWSWSTLIADYDNDGYRDVFVTNGLLRDIRNTDATKKFTSYVQETIADYLMNNPNGGDVTIWDIMDLDEAMDLVPSKPLSNYAFRNNGDLTFTKEMDEWGLDIPSFSNGAAYGDLDNDGDLDLVINNVNREAFLFRNNSEAISDHHYFRVRPVDDTNHPVIGTRMEVEYGDKYQVAEITSVRGIYSTSEHLAHFGVGNATAIDRLTVTWPDGNVQVLTNLDTDQELTVRYGNSVDEPIKGGPRETLFANVTVDMPVLFDHRENDFNDYDKQVLLPHKMSTYGPALAVADINGDGLEDIYAGGAANQPGKLLSQQPDGTFVEVSGGTWSADQKYEDVGAVFFDFDGDDDPDLYVVSGGNAFSAGSDLYQDRLYRNDEGTFTRTEGALPKLTSSGYKARPCDFDKDGDLDLFVGGRHIPWAYPEPASSTLLLNEGGTFKDITKKSARDLKEIGMVNDAVWADLDGDGWTDLVLAGEWMPLTWLKNVEGELELQENESLAPTTGWWFSVEAADMDNDGDLDLLAGNLGLNYKYKASDEEPFEVFYDDFDANGSMDIVLAYYNFGTLYPLRGRSCSSDQVPFIKNKFETYSEFAMADVEDVYGGSNLKRSLHYTANTFASAYIENRGDGQFQVHALPNEAQLSSVNDFIIRDFNRDGSKDVLLAGNLYGSEIETTRNDAGIGLYLEMRDGTLEPVDRMESGFFLPYDVKYLEEITIAGESYVLAACNDDRLQILKINQPSEIKGP